MRWCWRWRCAVFRRGMLADDRKGGFAELPDRRPGVAGGLGNRRVAGGEIPGAEIIADLDLLLRLLEYHRVDRLCQQRPADHAGFVGGAVKGRVADKLRQLVPIGSVLDAAVFVPALLAKSEHDFEIVDGVTAWVELGRQRAL